MLRNVAKLVAALPVVLMPVAFASTADAAPANAAASACVSAATSHGQIPNVPPILVTTVVLTNQCASFDWHHVITYEWSNRFGSLPGSGSVCLDSDSVSTTLMKGAQRDYPVLHYSVETRAGQC